MPTNNAIYASDVIGEVERLIVIRLKKLLGPNYPRLLRDIYVKTSRQEGSDFDDSTLEVLWLLEMAKIFDDVDLRLLVCVRHDLSEENLADLE